MKKKIKENLFGVEMFILEIIEFDDLIYTGTTSYMSELHTMIDFTDAPSESLRKKKIKLLKCMIGGAELSLLLM